jgi:hypothetical protein
MITVDSSAKKTLAKTAVRYVVVAAGGALVARGAISQDVAAQLAAPVTEVIVGGLMALVGLIGGLFVSKKRHSEVKLLADLVPDAVAKIK